MRASPDRWWDYAERDPETAWFPAGAEQVSTEIWCPARGAIRSILLFWPMVFRLEKGTCWVRSDKQPRTSLCWNSGRLLAIMCG